MALTRLAHHIVREHFVRLPKTLAIDATCGNGHDTEFLARLGFNKVIGFDVQPSAIKHTAARLKAANLDNTTLVQRNHQFMGEYITEELACVMFNFGYLPKADKSITTLSETSLIALYSALNNLASNGLICLICYPGHPEGAIETKAIQCWLQTLENRWHVTQQLSKAARPDTPVLYTITAQGQLRSKKIN